VHGHQTLLCRRSRRALLAVALAMAIIGLTPTAAAAHEPLANPVWLCKPGMANNPCGQNTDGGPMNPAVNGSFAMHYPSGKSEPLDATIVASDGSLRQEPYQGLRN
jgi:hypothetical protein